MAGTIAYEMLGEIIAALDLPATAADGVRFDGSDRMPSCFPVSDLAVASIGAACAAIAELAAAGGAAADVAVDYRLAALWFGWSIRPEGWEMPSALGCDRGGLPGT